MLILRKFKELAPIVSVVIILFGLFNQMFFYSHFGIEIQHYLTVSELILSACTQLIYIIVGTIFIALNFYLHASGAKPRIDSAIEKKYGYSWKFLKAELLISCIALGLIISILIFNRQKNFLYSLIWLIVYQFYIVIIFIVRLIFQKIQLPFNPSYFNTIVLSIVLVVMLWYVTDNDIKKCEKGRFFGTVITTKDSTYISDSSHFFIGKTEKFWFIKNRITQSTMVIPDAEIIKSEIKDR